MDLDSARILCVSLINTPVHLILTNSKWFNGEITQIDKKNFIFNEHKLGLLPIPLESISKIELWREKKQ